MKQRHHSWVMTRDNHRYGHGKIRSTDPGLAQETPQGRPAGRAVSQHCLPVRWNSAQQHGHASCKHAAHGIQAEAIPTGGLPWRGDPGQDKAELWLLGRVGTGLEGGPGDFSR